MQCAEVRFFRNNGNKQKETSDSEYVISQARYECKQAIVCGIRIIFIITFCLLDGVVRALFAAVCVCAEALDSNEKIHEMDTHLLL